MTEHSIVTFSKVSFHIRLLIRKAPELIYALAFEKGSQVFNFLTKKKPSLHSAKKLEEKKNFKMEMQFFGLDKAIFLIFKTR